MSASVFRATLPVWLLMAACAGPEVSSVQDPIAPEDRDRESWGVRLQLHSQNSASDSTGVASVTVEAPYITDHIDLQLTRADSGVTVTLADSTHDVITRLSAHRLVVDHRAHTVALAGSVQARSPGRNVTLRADTLIWDRPADRLTGPAGVRVKLSSGELSAAVLAGGSDLAQWHAQQVRSTFRDSASTAHELEIVAPTAQVSSNHAAVMASFDSARVHWRGRQVRARHVTYDGELDELRLSGAVRLDDSIRQVRADTVVVALSGGRFVARGDVRVTGDVELQAVQLTEDGDGQWSVAGEPLRLEVDGRRVRARSMSLSADNDSVQVTGAAWAAEGDRTIEADSMLLLRADDELRAAGSVRVQAADVEGDLQAQQMRIHGTGGQLLLWGAARLRRSRQAGDDLTLRADTLRLEPDGGGLTGRGRFVLQSPPRVTLRARGGTYQTTTEAAMDTSLLVGDTEFLYENDGSSSRLAADSCRVILDGGTPATVVWPVSLRGHLQDAEQTSWLQAHSGRGELADGRLSHLALEGQVQVTHRGEGERLSRFTASAMGLQYDDEGVLYRVQAEGQALVRTRTPGGSLNEVGGERLEVTLTDGAVASVRVVEAIEGRFVPDDDDQQQE